MPKITVLLADDHGVLRAGLRMLLDAQPDMAVIAEAEDGLEAVRQAATTTPDIALVDITMPRLGGLEAIGRIRQVSPRTRVVVLTMHDDQAYASAAMAAGAAGHILKDVDAGELLSAIRAVHRGRTFIDLSRPGVANAMVGSRAARRGEAPDPSKLLSQREWQVLRLVAQGHANREIAERLGLSVKTVETYRTRLAEKLGLRTRAAIVGFAVDLGLLAPGRAAADEPQ